MSRGFTLLELLIAIGITLLGLVMSAPSMNDFFAKHQIKMTASDLSAAIIKARSIAISTECQSSINISPVSANQVSIKITVSKNKPSHGCSYWFNSSGNSNSTSITVYDEITDSVRILNNINLQFLGVSGKIAGNTIQSIELSWKGLTGRLTADGIGNGTLQIYNQ